MAKDEAQSDQEVEQTALLILVEVLREELSDEQFKRIAEKIGSMLKTKLKEK